MQIKWLLDYLELILMGTSAALHAFAVKKEEGGREGTYYMDA